MRLTSKIVSCPNFPRSYHLPETLARSTTKSVIEEELPFILLLLLLNFELVLQVLAYQSNFID